MDCMASVYQSKLEPHMGLKTNILLCLIAACSKGTKGLLQHTSYKHGNFSDRTFRLVDNMSDLPHSRTYPLLWYDEVTSTMDTAKELCKTRKETFFAVTAGQQTKGRGTRGRDWISANRNLLLTVAVRRQLLPIPITLLPLRVGTIVASCMARRVTTPGSVLTLKWPNDILINGHKACGMLIEMEGDMLLIGIGCNVMHAPAVNAATNNANASPLIRPATCLADHNEQLASLLQREDEALSVGVAASGSANIARENSGSSAKVQIEGVAATVASQGPVPTIGASIFPTLSAGDVHKELGIEICDNLHDWLASGTDSAALVTQDFARNMDFSPQRLRDEPDPALGTVVPVGLNPDGTLQVRYVHNGEEATLMAEYLW